jgi:membrane protein implicated in regulation of membrane protease activity
MASQVKHVQHNKLLTAEISYIPHCFFIWLLLLLAAAMPLLPLLFIQLQLSMVTWLPSSPSQLARKSRMHPSRFTAAEDSMSEQSMDRVIVVTSGKGGVGKTTTTANLGMSIAR